MTSTAMKRVLIGAAVMIMAVGGGVAVGVATGGDDDADEVPISGAALEHASSAALAHVGGGRVTGTEAGDEEGAYEVEVTRADGTEVDVHLDESFRILGSESDGADDSEGDDR